jgi:NADH:ubiquinone oxidoreductase subunit 3 (subunit A)
MVQSLSYETVLTVIVYVQPVIVGLALFLVYRKRLASRSLFSQQRGVRRHLKSIRFFECASFSRLIGQLHYDLPILALSVLFLLYDIDLVFFFAEAANWSN